MTAFRLKHMRRRYVALVTAVTTAVALTVIPTGPSASAQPAASAQTAAAAKLAAATKLTAEFHPTAFMKPAQLTSGTLLCLTNADEYCLGVNIPWDEIINTGLSAATLVVAILTYKFMTKKPTPPDQGDTEDEIVVEGEEDNDAGAGLCVADTGGDAFMTSCGADGTVWIVIPHTDGYYLESRYLYDNGDPNQVLTVDPLDSGASVYCFNEENPGSAYWQTWSSNYLVLGPNR
jgi:hypothetical protein